MRKRLLLLSALGLMILAAVSAVYVISPAFAQQPPPPPPKDDPPVTGACCRVLEATGRTIGGPGLVTASVESSDKIFESPKKMPFCVTVENTGAREIEIAVCEERAGIACRLAFTSRKLVQPGHTATACAEGISVTVYNAPGSSYRWRVDSVD